MRRPSQDLEPRTGIPLPYWVEEKGGHIGGYKVHVGDMPRSPAYEEQVAWVQGVLERRGCRDPDDFGPAMDLSLLLKGQMLLTFRSLDHAQRAQVLLDRVDVGDAYATNARFWMPQLYDAWASDPRFYRVPRT